MSWSPLSSSSRSGGSCNTAVVSPLPFWDVRQDSRRPNLSLIAGTLLSLAFSYIPRLRELFDSLEPTGKRLVMLGLLVVTAGMVQSLACLGWGAEWDLSLTCDQAGLAGLIEQLVIAVIANQSVYAISPRRRAKFSLVGGSDHK